jgi:hypothetical protein
MIFTHRWIDVECFYCCADSTAESWGSVTGGDMCWRSAHREGLNVVWASWVQFSKKLFPGSQPLRDPMVIPGHPSALGTRACSI